MFTAIPITLLSLATLTSAGVLTGSGIISVENYPDIGPNSPDNPPYCGMAWDSLDLNLVTAAQGLTKDQCGTCLLVCGAEPNGCEYILVVDRGGRNLDLSTGISGHIIGTVDGIAWAEWRPVPEVFCSHIHQSDGEYGISSGYGEPSYEGSAASASGISVESSPITSLTTPGLETPSSIATSYVVSTPIAPASTSILDYLAPSPAIPSLTSTDSTPASVVVGSVSLLPLITTFLTSTSSAPAMAWSSISYVCPQYPNATRETNSSSTSLGSKGSMLSGTNCSCPADLNTTVTYGSSNESNNSTSGYKIRGLRWFR